jgi:sortase (surface protein transpeptidase)
MGSLRRVQDRLKLLNECVKDSLTELRELKDKNLEEFKDIFQIEGDIAIYFNEYNIVLIDHEAHEGVKPYLKESDLVIRLEIPEHEINIWVYQYFNERIFNDYLKS